MNDFQGLFNPSSDVVEQFRRGRFKRSKGMDTTKVKRDVLLGIVTTNRDAHRDLFLKAQEGFRVQVVKRLDEMLADARAGRRYDLSVNMAPPVDQTKDYGRVIRQLELSVDEVIELDETQFANYVMDDWNWSQNVRHLNSTYAAFA